MKPLKKTFHWNKVCGIFTKPFEIQNYTIFRATDHIKTILPTEALYTTPYFHSKSELNDSRANISYLTRKFIISNLSESARS